MKAIVIFALLALTAFSYDLKAKQTSFVQTATGLQSAMNSLKESQTGAMLMNLAEVQMLTGGPLEELVQALKDLTASNQKALAEENDDFTQETTRHELEVKRLEVLIQEITIDINTNQQQLDNVLYPRRESLENQISTLQQQIQDTQETIVRETAQRKREHEDFIQKEAETEAVIAACGEALELLRSLLNGQTSLAQVRVAQKAMKKIQDKLANLKGTPMSEFVLALTELAQNFADQSAVQNVIALIENVRTESQSFLADIRQSEAEAADVWANQRLPQLQTDLANFQANLAQAQADLKTTNETIAKTEKHVAQRTKELAAEKENLATENANYEARTQLHVKLVAKFNGNIEACQSALNIVTSQNFSDYFHQTVNQL